MSTKFGLDDSYHEAAEKLSRTILESYEEMIEENTELAAFVVISTLTAMSVICQKRGIDRDLINALHEEVWKEIRERL